MPMVVERFWVCFFFDPDELVSDLLQVHTLFTL